MLRFFAARIAICNAQLGISESCLVFACYQIVKNSEIVFLVTLLYKAISFMTKTDKVSEGREACNIVPKPYEMYDKCGDVQTTTRHHTGKRIKTFTSSLCPDTDAYRFGTKRTYTKISLTELVNRLVLLMLP